MQATFSKLHGVSLAAGMGGFKVTATKYNTIGDLIKVQLTQALGNFFSKVPLVFYTKSLAQAE